MILPFHGYQFALELQSARYQEKKLLRETIVKNGGEISYILTRKTDFVVVSKDCDTYKTRAALKCNIPVVHEQFVFDCNFARKLLKPFEYLAKDDSKLGKFKKGCIVVEKETETKPLPHKKPFHADKFDWQNGKLKNLSDFTIFKFALYSGELNSDVVTCALELQVSNENNNELFRIVKSSSLGTQNVPEEVKFCLLDDVDFAERLYEDVYEKDRNAMQEFKRLNQLERNQSVGTPKLRMWLDEMKCILGDVHPSVSQLLSVIWENAIGFTKSELLKNLADITTEDILNALAILKNMSMCLDQNEKMEKLRNEFFQCISFCKNTKINTKRDVSHMEEFCNLLFDIVQVNEVSSDKQLDAINFYRTIKCSINYVEPNSKEFMDVSSNLNISKPAGFNVCNIYKISRRDEENLGSVFDSCSNVRRLFHCSKQDNFVGILTNGLLLPDVTSDKLGVSRSDPGKLGSGLYFTNSLTGCTSYSSVMKGRGTRYMLINDVALGECYETCKSDETLSSAPEGFQSVCGVPGEKSDFSFNEFVVYKTEQQRIRYLVEFTLKDDEMINSSSTDVKSFSAEQLPTIKSQAAVQPFDLSTFKDPTFAADLGLIVKEGGNRMSSVQLKEVHVRGKLIDFSAEVHVFQVYVNSSTKTLEAKYVFPLTDNAAVCGFEAFINEKHVIGEVKEKEKAHKEYKEAVAAGHGAYLMDQDNANLFTVSVGNIPPNARVVIKISYISELNVCGGQDQSISFKIPGYIANSKQDRVLAKGGVTQTTTKISSVKSKENINTSLQLSLDMPFDILDIESVSHKIITKQTKTKACIKLSSSSRLDGNDFVLNVKVAEIHVPRMWIEEDEAHQANMISFYPEFEFGEIHNSEVIILLDMSNSISACEKESRTVACGILSKLPKECHFNVIRFGSYFEEHFVVSKPNSDDNVASAKQFIIDSQPIMGTSDVYQVMNTFTMLKRRNPVNMFLISDGNLDRKSKCSNIVMKLPASNRRVFTMGVGRGGDEHYLKVMANQAGGYYEQFDNQQKFKWISKVESQCEKANQPALCNAEIVWLTHDDPVSPTNEFLPIKAPIQIKSIFGGTRIMAYSYVQNCSQAVLKATVGNRDFELMVSASTFNTLQGKSIHRLTAKNIIHESEHENLHDVRTSHILLKKLQKQAIIDMSIKYSITSQYTSFVAIEKREKNENLSVRRGPSVQEILSYSTFDTIPEIEWDFSKEAPSTETQVLNMLKNIAITETFSALRAREMALECSKIVLPKDHPYNLLQTANTLPEFDEQQAAFQIQQRSVTQTLSNSLLQNRNINYENIEAIMKNENQLNYSTAITDLVNFAFPMYSDLVCSLEIKLRPLFAGYIIKLRWKKVMIEDALQAIRDCLDEGRSLKEAFSWCSDEIKKITKPRTRTPMLLRSMLSLERVLPAGEYEMTQLPISQPGMLFGSVERPLQLEHITSLEQNVPRKRLSGGGPPGAKPPGLISFQDQNVENGLLSQHTMQSMKRLPLRGGGMAPVRPPVMAERGTAPVQPVLMVQAQLAQRGSLYGSLKDEEPRPITRLPKKIERSFVAPSSNALQPEDIPPPIPPKDQPLEWSVQGQAESVKMQADSAPSLRRFARRSHRRSRASAISPPAAPPIPKDKSLERPVLQQAQSVQMKADSPRLLQFGYESGTSLHKMAAASPKPALSYESAQETQAFARSIKLKKKQAYGIARKSSATSVGMIATAAPPPPELVWKTVKRNIVSAIPPPPAPPLPPKDQPLKLSELPHAQSVRMQAGFTPPRPVVKSSSNVPTNDNFSLKPVKRGIFDFKRSMPSAPVLGKDEDERKIAEIQELMKLNMESLLDRSETLERKEVLEELSASFDDKCLVPDDIPFYSICKAQQSPPHYRSENLSHSRRREMLSETSSNEDSSDTDEETFPIYADSSTSGSDIEDASCEISILEHMESNIDEILQEYSTDEFISEYEIHKVLSEDHQLYYPFCDFDILQTDKSDSEKDVLQNWHLEYLDSAELSETIVVLLWILKSEMLPSGIHFIKKKLHKLGLNSLPLKTQSIALELLHLSILVAICRLMHIVKETPIPKKLKQILIKAKHRIIALDKASPLLYSTLDIGANWYDSALKMLPCLSKRKLTKWTTALLHANKK